MTTIAKHTGTVLRALLTDLETTVPVAIDEIEEAESVTLPDPAYYTQVIGDETHLDHGVVELSTEGTREEDFASPRRDTVAEIRLALLHYTSDDEDEASYHARLYTRALLNALGRSYETAGAYQLDVLTTEPEEWLIGQRRSNAAVVRADLRIRTSRVEA